MFQHRRDDLFVAVVLAGPYAQLLQEPARFVAGDLARLAGAVLARVGSRRLSLQPPEAYFDRLTTRVSIED